MAEATSRPLVPDRSDTGHRDDQRGSQRPPAAELAEDRAPHGSAGGPSTGPEAKTPHDSSAGAEPLSAGGREPAISPEEANAAPPATGLSADPKPTHLRKPSPLRQLLADDGALFVDDAGLVILAPYLPAYFGRLGLVAERQFVSAAARQRAVLLLRYLATATADATEHLLALDKLLCGWPLAEPIERSIRLSEQEEEESRELLASVVEAWTALKQTSVDGLRGSFLVREGRLTEDEQGWQLTVQRTGWDVLLDRLPWGLSLVMFPWMDQPIFVEW